MAEMTKEERAWVKKLQRLLSNPPSDRLGFFTVGDRDVTIYDCTKDQEINDYHDTKETGEFCGAVDHFDARLGELIFPSGVHSTCG